MTLRIRLVDRILQSRGRRHLRDLLRNAKKSAGGAAKFTTGGDDAALRKSVAEALAGNFVSDAELIALADRLEEIGGQHIYLYKLTAAGKAALTAGHLQSSFAEAVPSEAYYTDTPAGHAIQWVARDGTVFLKQIQTTAYWERDDVETVWTDDIRRRVWKKIQRRAVNTFLVDQKKATVEICIDRVKGENDETLADAELTRFLTALEPLVSEKEHLVAVRVAHAFTKIVGETAGEAYMNADSIETPSIAQKLSNKRKGTKLPDIRTNADYVRAKPKGDRDSLTIYWYTADAPKPVAKEKDEEEFEPDEDDDEDLEAGKGRRPAVHTIISAVKRVVEKSLTEHCKVYISAKISEKDRAHVISRIRHFAG